MKNKQPVQKKSDSGKQRTVRRKKHRSDRDDFIAPSSGSMESGESQLAQLPEMMNTRPLRHAALLQMQQQRGNAYVQRLLHPQAKTDEETPVATSGSLEPVEGEELEKEGCEEPGKKDATPTSSQAQKSPHKRLRVKASLTLVPVPVLPDHVDSDEHKSDAVKSALTMGSSVTQGGTVSAGNFGEEHVKYKVDKASWTLSSGVVNVNARVFVACEWNINSQGHIGVDGANDWVVRSFTWKKIVEDLQPSADGRPKRDFFWAPDLTERHEKFHAQDDISRATTYLPTVQAWLDTQTVTAPNGTWNYLRMLWELNGLLNTAQQNVEADGWDYYNNIGIGGEGRAYADGKALYQQRVDDIKTRAATEGWT